MAHTRLARACVCVRAEYWIRSILLDIPFQSIIERTVSIFMYLCFKSRDLLMGLGQWLATHWISQFSNWWLFIIIIIFQHVSTVRNKLLFYFLLFFFTELEKLFYKIKLARVRRVVKKSHSPFSKAKKPKCNALLRIIF